jgi:predicted AlkP superfamily pyrophosphatase or phosphodiesterase
LGAEPAIRAGRTAVLDVVGLTQALLARMPRLSAWAAGKGVAPIAPVLPAVTCSMQATYLTGAPPSRHGIVGNGWYFRDECEVKFWRQSNRLVQQPKIWELAKRFDPGFTCANLFWWFNMYSSADIAVTPRPMYPADGRKLPDLWTHPEGLRASLQRELGRFPLFDFWGPATSIRSSEWIAGAARAVEARFRPSLSLVYLPHLDYALQRHGPRSASIERDVQEIDRVCGELIAHYEARGVEVVVLSEYGISEVRRPVALNRVLREHGYLAVREELGRELLDPGASRAFAVADHQVAHVYVADPAELSRVRALLEKVKGVERVHARTELPGLDHSRAGELVAVAAPDAWFSYYYWLDERKAPDFARTVDIHRKPGYDPAELFIDPRIGWPRLKIAQRLLQKKLGFRTLLDVIPLDASLVKGSHGRADGTEVALVIGRAVQAHRRYAAVEVMDLILEHLFGDEFLLLTKTIGEKS